MTNIIDLESYCNAFFTAWQKNYGTKEYVLCKKACLDFIEELIPIYAGRLYGEGEDQGTAYNFIYLFLMLAKGLENLISLVDLTKDKAWPQSNERTESIWQMLWDTKERLDVFKIHYLDQNFLAGIFEQLDKLEYCFYNIYGKGIYMSPVTLIRKAECSICNINIKACDHIPGNLYDGRYCKEVIVDFELRGADFVESPYDMRCRVWPWNFIDQNHINVRIMNINVLDGFIHEK